MKIANTKKSPWRDYGDEVLRRYYPVQDRLTNKKFAPFNGMFRVDLKRICVMERMEVSLPYPPSVNRYWRSKALWRTGKVYVYVTESGAKYRKLVGQLIMIKNGINFGDKKIKMEVDLYPPDKRRRDIDNPLKILIDALQHAKVYDDDSQIQSLLVNKHESMKGGKVDIRIYSWE